MRKILMAVAAIAMAAMICSVVEAEVPKGGGALVPVGDPSDKVGAEMGLMSDPDGDKPINFSDYSGYYASIDDYGKGYGDWTILPFNGIETGLAGLYRNPTELQLARAYWFQENRNFGHILYTIGGLPKFDGREFMAVGVYIKTNIESQPDLSLGVLRVTALCHGLTYDIVLNLQGDSLPSDGFFLFEDSPVAISSVDYFWVQMGIERVPGSGNQIWIGNVCIVGYYR